MTVNAGPEQQDVADFYDRSTRLLAEVNGGSLHFGYWDEQVGEGGMDRASRRLTEMMIERIGVGPADTVLDIGCGTGEPALQLARATGARVVGITISPEQVAQAERGVAHSGLGDRVTFRCADAMDLPFPADSFDAVWLFESIFHMPNRVTPLTEAARVVRPGGRVALTDVLHHAEPEAPGTEPGEELPFATLFGESIRIGDYPELLSRARLKPVEVTDITDRTVDRTLEFIHRQIEADRTDLTVRYGADLVEQVDAATRMLGAAGLGYAIVTAERPPTR